LSLPFSSWTIKPWFYTEGKLVAVLITPSLGVSNWTVIYIINTMPPICSDDILSPICDNSNDVCDPHPFKIPMKIV
jgi:hypothetical protein